MTHSTLRQWDKALTDFSKAIELQPNHANAWNNRGWAHYNLRQWPKALADYTRAIELKPDLMPAWQFRAVTRNSQGQWDQAVSDYTKAIELQKDNSEAQLGLAWLLATHPEPSRRDPGRAVELASKAVTLEPKQGDYWLVLGMAQYRAENWTEVRTALEKSMALRNGGDANDWYFLAMTQWRLGNTDQARQSYDRAIQ